MLLSRGWGTERLRSPVPLPGGRAVAFVQPGRAGGEVAAALWFVSAAEELVPGDLVFLQSGDRVPADLRLLRLRELRMDSPVSPCR